MAKKQNGWDSPENEVQSAWVKFNVPLEDKVYGTLLSKSVRTSTIKGREGQKQNIYEMQLQMGSWHILDEKENVVGTPVVAKNGDFVQVGGTSVLDRQMKNIAVGQIIGMKFIEEQPSKTKSFSPTKIIKVYAPKNEAGDGPLMDDEVVNQKNVENFDSN